MSNGEMLNYYPEILQDANIDSLYRERFTFDGIQEWLSGYGSKLPYGLVASMDFKNLKWRGIPLDCGNLFIGRALSHEISLPEADGTILFHDETTASGAERHIVRVAGVTTNTQADPVILAVKYDFNSGMAVAATISAHHEMVPRYYRMDIPRLINPMESWSPQAGIITKAMTDFFEKHQLAINLRDGSTLGAGLAFDQETYQKMREIGFSTWHDYGIFRLDYSGNKNHHPWQVIFPDRLVNIGNRQDLKTLFEFE